MTKKNKNNSMHCPLAEQSVLGALMIENCKFFEVSQIISSNDFFDNLNQKIFMAIGELVLNKKPCDVIILSEYINSNKSFDISEGEAISYVTQLVLNTPSAANIIHYAKIVKEKSIRRKLSDLGETLTNSSENLPHLIALLENSLKNSKNLDSENLADDNKKLNKVALNDFLQLELPSRQLILSPWLSSQSLSMIYAPRGLGKTHVSLGIAYAIACGGKFLNWDAAKSHGVLFVDGELPGYVLQERLANIVTSTDKFPVAPLEIITPDLQPHGMPDLGTYEGQQQINNLITDQIDVIILDNLSTLVKSGKENEGESWQPIQAWALDLRSKGKSVVFIHHSGKTGQQRGTSRREDALDTVIALKKPDDYSPENGATFEIHYEKTRGFCGESAKPFLAQLKYDDSNKQYWTVNSLEQSNFEKVVDLYNQGLIQKEISEELNLGKSTISKYITRAKDEGLINLKGDNNSSQRNSFTVSSHR